MAARSGLSSPRRPHADRARRGRFRCRHDHRAGGVSAHPVRDDAGSCPGVAPRVDVLRIDAREPQRDPGGRQVASPLYPSARSCSAHLNTATGIKALSFSGMDIFIVALFFIAYAASQNRDPRSTARAGSRLRSRWCSSRSFRCSAPRSSGWWAWCGEASSPCRSGSSIA